MKLQDLTRFIESKDVGSITFTRFEDVWEVWIDDHEPWGDEQEITTISRWGNKLVTGRTGEPKTYTSLDRAYSAMRKLGYSGSIKIDG
jgi:hypothetical protein